MNEDDQTLWRRYKRLGDLAAREHLLKRHMPLVRFTLERMTLSRNHAWLDQDDLITAGILDGDLALVRPQQTADNKDTVVAMVDGEATVKWFHKEQDHIRLQPANPFMKPILIYPEDGEVTIVGKVIGIYRQL